MPRTAPVLVDDDGYPTEGCRGGVRLSRLGSGVGGPAGASVVGRRTLLAVDEWLGGQVADGRAGVWLATGGVRLPKGGGAITAGD